MKAIVVSRRLVVPARMLFVLAFSSVNIFSDGLPLADFQSNDFAGSANCSACHTELSDQGGNDVSLDTHWRSTMMANGAKDPLWQAKMESEVARNPALKEIIEAKCATCHTPMARTQAIVDGQPVALTGDGFFNPTNQFHVAAMDGISCSLCHQVMPDNLGSPESFSGGYEIDTATTAPDRLIYGPFADPFERQMQNNLGFTPAHGSHTTDSALCGACHNLYTPYVDAQGAVLGEFPEQMVYSEWEHSGYNDGPESRTCQECHMPAAAGGVVLSNRGGPGLGLEARSPFGRHHFVGGNVFMLNILETNLVELGISASSVQLADTRERTQDQLQHQTAYLSVAGLRVTTSGLEVDLFVENRVGHKLPSGFPSRRAWLHVAVADKTGDVFFESGKPLADGRIEGNDADTDLLTCEPHYDRIQQPDQVQIYEAVMQNSDGDITYTLLRGAAYRKDNRLLPIGFDAATAPTNIAVVGLAQGDADFLGGADRITYAVNTAEREGPYEISVELLYQTVAWSFAQDLFRDSGDAVERFSGYYTAADHTPEILAAGVVVLDPSQAYRLEPPLPVEQELIQLPLSGPVGGRVAVDWSTNLTDWARLTTVEQTNELMLVNDALATNGAARFYRLEQP